jgi:hypothetical protein
MGTGNKLLGFDKASKVYPFLQRKDHYSSNVESLKFKQYFPNESRLFQLKQCPIPQGLNQGLQNLPSASFHSTYGMTV